MRLFRFLLSLLKINSSFDIFLLGVNSNNTMYCDQTVEIMKNSNIISDLQFCNVSIRVNEENQRLKIFVKKFVNRILHSAKLKDRIVKPELAIITKLPVSITTEELSRLTALEEKFKISDLDELDRLLSVVFSYERKIEFESLASYPNFESTAIMVCIFLVVVTIWMFAVDTSFKKIMLFLYLLCFLGGLVFNAWHMYMEAISEQIAQSKRYMAISHICNSKKTTWWSHLFFSKNKCLEFEKTSRINPLSKVIPSLVFSHTLSIMFTHPLQELGARCGDFLVGVSNAAPWPLNLIFLPFVLIVFCLLFLFVIMTQMGASFNCWTWVGGLSIKLDHYQSRKIWIDDIGNMKKIRKIKNNGNLITGNRKR